MYNFNQLACFCRPGQDLYKKEQLYKMVNPIPIGTRLYKAGIFPEELEEITVGESIRHNQKSCTMFFGSLYFRTFEEAERITKDSHEYWTSFLVRKEDK